MTQLPGRDPMKSKNEQGVYNKFKVTRTDGKSGPGEKHDGCEYFVLDLDHDPYAYDAIQMYANRCARDYPQLATDLREKLRTKAFGKLDGPYEKEPSVSDTGEKP